jgi:hypothetical protein
MMMHRLEADLCRHLNFVADIDLGCGILAYTNDIQPRRKSMDLTQIGNFGRNLGNDLVSNFSSAKNSCSHKEMILTDAGIGVSIAGEEIARYHFNLS